MGGRRGKARLDRATTTTFVEAKFGARDLQIAVVNGRPSAEGQVRFVLQEFAVKDIQAPKFRIAQPSSFALKPCETVKLPLFSIPKW